jgi:hypothetical protein
VVAATDAAEPKEIPMTKAKSKHQTASRSNSSKTTGRNSAARTTVRKTAKLKPGTQSAAGQRHRSSAEQTGRPKSKQARVIAMLRAPSGATIDAMAHATGWQQHSVRGFLAGVVRKKLGLNLVSAAGESGRIYRITDRTVSPVEAAKTSRAA